MCLRPKAIGPIFRWSSAHLSIESTSAVRFVWTVVPVRPCAACVSECFPNCWSACEFQDSLVSILSLRAPPRSKPVLRSSSGHPGPVGLRLPEAICRPVLTGYPLHIAMMIAAPTGWDAPRIRAPLRAQPPPGEHLDQIWRHQCGDDQGDDGRGDKRFTADHSPFSGVT